MRRLDSGGGTMRLCRDLGALDPRRLAWACCTGALASGCAIGLLATSGWLITRASLRPPVLSLSIAIGAVQAFALGRGTTRYLERLAVHDVSLSALSRLRLVLYDTLEPLVPGALGPGHSGRILSAFVNDSETVVEALAKVLTASIDVVSSLLLGVLLALFLDPTASAVLAVGALVLVFAGAGSARLGRRAATTEAEVRAELADSVVETVRSAPELVVYGRDDLVAAQLERVRATSGSAGARRALTTGLGRAAVMTCGAATLIAVIVSGLAAHDAHRLSGVLLAVLVFDTLAVLDAANGLPLALAGLVAGNTAAGRLKALTRLEPLVHEPGGNGPDAPAPDTVGHCAPVMGMERPVVALENARVLGRDGVVVLDDVTFGTMPQRKLALVGHNGAGKTSAIYTLLHFLECSSGRATLDGNDVSSLTRARLAHRVGWLPEETHVFATTLRANLLLARPTADDDSCTEALRRVGLGVWLDSLPDELATRIGTGGRAMSAGERQRLGMARALLAGGDVLLLDEPTAHLDAASAARLLPRLLFAAEHHTVIVTGHDRDLFSQVNDVVTLDAGRVLEVTCGRTHLGHRRGGEAGVSSYASDGADPTGDARRRRDLPRSDVSGRSRASS
jgi:thiol reductant ABC exporter CydC subunit